MRARGLNVPSGTCAPPAGVLGLVPWISLTRTIPAHAVLVSAGTWLWLLCIRLVTTGRRHEASRFGAAMKVFLLLLVLLFALVVGVLAWGAYETLRATVEGRLRPRTVLALLAVGLVLLLILVGAGDLDYWWEIPDAVACSDQAEIVIEAIPGPASGGLGSVREWDFLYCTAYWYT